MDVERLKSWSILAEMGWHVRRILDSLEGRGTAGRLTYTSVCGAGVALHKVSGISDENRLGFEDLVKLQQVFATYLEYLDGNDRLYVDLITTLHEVRKSLLRYNGSI